MIKMGKTSNETILGMRRILITLMFTFLPIIASAQGAGGHIIRPTKKQEQKPAKRVDKTRKQTMSEAERERILNNLINNMVYVEGGTFMMGSSVDDDMWTRGKPRHEVILSSFKICKFEVTQEEWQAIMGENPSFHKGKKYPVECVTWNNCIDFIHRLNDITGNHFRLPTEAEWEFAARGGNKSSGYYYAGGNDSDSVMWHYSNSGRHSHVVGTKRPNELGLFDMCGNVGEWVEDWYVKRYIVDVTMNPKGPNNGMQKVIRGGSFYGGDVIGGVSERIPQIPHHEDMWIGLRLVQDITK